MHHSTPSRSCPDCDQLMDTGFLTAQSSPIYWAVEESEGNFLASMAEQLTDAPGPLRNAQSPAWLCRNCGVVLFQRTVES